MSDVFKIDNADEALEMLISLFGLAEMMGKTEIPLPLQEVRWITLYTHYLRKGIREVCEAEDGTLVSREVREKLLVLIDGEPTEAVPGE